MKGLQLLALALLLSCTETAIASSAPVIREHQCDFESGDLCGWLGPIRDLTGEFGLTNATAALPLGPQVDANPGTETGTYFYFYTRVIPTDTQLLRFPTHQYICELSFAYYTAGPLDLDILRENMGVTLVFVNQTLSNLADRNTSSWERALVNYNTSQSDLGALVFEAFESDLGEAILDADESDFFLALDDLNVTFCLPCDFDSLSLAGNLLLGAPSSYDVVLGSVDQFSLNASSPACPDMTLVFEIESVHPQQVSPIFTIDTQTGVVTVNGSGPNLDANGTRLGILTLSVHILGSNYTHTGAPFKQTAAVSFQQPPTILIQSPSNTTVAAEAHFSFPIESTSNLPLAHTLLYMIAKTTPEELQNDVELLVADNGTTILSGQISLTSVVQVLDLGVTPMVSIRIANEYTSYVVYNLTFHFQDQAPLFNQTHYDFSIEEEIDSSAVGSFALIDPNGDNLEAELPHFVNPPSPNPFLILGQVEPRLFDLILVSRSLDYEEQVNYTLNMEAVDAVNPLLTSSATVTVNVLPINEFPPVFETPDEAVTITDNKPVGYVIVEFRATDDDSGPDGEIVYSITAGNEDGFFDVASPQNGMIVVRHSPILSHSYSLTVTATDRGMNPGPMSSHTTLDITVIASQPVDCSAEPYGPPIVESPEEVILEQPIGRDTVLQCAYFANPVAVYKWEVFHQGVLTATGQGITLYSSSSNEHYTVHPHSLTVHNLTTNDAGFYRCDVTNQCGSRRIHYQMIIIDRPRPSENLRVTDGPYSQNVSIEWTIPAEVQTSFFSQPLEGFTVQVKQVGDAGPYQSVAEFESGVNSTTITDLLPGTSYDIRVLATNFAGSTPSETLNITTIATIPKLKFLRATALQNNSLLLEWELEFNGGFAISEFTITIEVQAHRERREALEYSLSMEQVEAGVFVTRALEEGRFYSIIATAGNQLGATGHTTSAFVGYTESVQCSFEPDSNTGCPWQLDESIVSEGTDASGNSQGHYVFLSLENAASSEAIVASYSEAGYVCGYSFYYQLHGDGELVLQSTSGDEIWTSRDNIVTNQFQWINVNTSEFTFATSSLTGGLQFVLVSDTTGTTDVRLDNVDLDFCLPCNFESLAEVEGDFYLSYTNFSRIYFGKRQTLTIEAIIVGCENAVLDFSIARAVPADLESSFELGTRSARSVTVEVDPVSPELAEPHTAGFLEVVVSVTHSDYKQTGSDISRAALIEFVLLEAAENCSLTDECDFETGLCGWELEQNVQNIRSENSPVDSLQDNTGFFLYGEYPDSSTNGPETIASTAIGDDYCAISFYYSASFVELQVSVDGLGSIWSSLVVSENTMSQGWVYEAVLIDLQSVQLLPERRLSFQVDLPFDVLGEANSDDGPLYFALDNITLHPCIDCNIPGCSLTSCLPGHYFSLVDDQCISCPPGYYCPNWRMPPQPCPTGTYSNSSRVTTERACQPCPPNTIALQPASTTCSQCPSGYECTDPNIIPTPLGGGRCTPCPAGYACLQSGEQEPCDAGQFSFEGQTTCQGCPAGFSCPDPSQAPVPSNTSCSEATEKVPVAAIVGGSLGGGCFLILLAACCIAFYYFRTKRAKEKRRRSERQRFLLSTADESSSLGSSSTLGRSSASSGTMGARGKKKWKKSRDASTLLSFMSDGTNAEAYCDETSWMEALRLASSEEQGNPEKATVTQNPVYVDDEEDMIELDDENAWKGLPQMPSASASNF